MGDGFNKNVNGFITDLAATELTKNEVSILKIGLKHIQLSQTKKIVKEIRSFKRKSTLKNLRTVKKYLNFPCINVVRCQH